MRSDETQPDPKFPRSALLTREERLEEFFVRMSAAAPASNPEEAIILISRLIEEIEDEFSGIPNRPNPGLRPDGRMYPPQSDRIMPDGTGGLVAFTRGHRIEIAVGGAVTFRLRRAPGTVVFTKGGT